MAGAPEFTLLAPLVLLHITVMRRRFGAVLRGKHERTMCARRCYGGVNRKKLNGDTMHAWPLPEQREQKRH
jgi:hypothetical protein